MVITATLFINEKIHILWPSFYLQEIILSPSFCLSFSPPRVCVPTHVCVCVCLSLSLSVGMSIRLSPAPSECAHACVYVYACLCLLCVFLCGYVPPPPFIHPPSLPPPSSPLLSCSHSLRNLSVALRGRRRGKICTVFMCVRGRLKSTSGVLCHDSCLLTTRLAPASLKDPRSYLLSPRNYRLFT